MVKKNKKYWKKRSEQLEEALLSKGENFANDLDNQYKIANVRIQKEINAWYQRFAKNNCLSLADAKKLLNSNELKELRWTVQDYIRYGQKNAVNQYWMEELENASCKVHISRLEALKLQLQQQVEVLYGNQLDGLDKTMRDIYSEGYYHTAFDIQKAFNTGYSLIEFNENELEKVISKPWALDGENFSNRVWKNKSKLINTLHTNLTQALIRGENPEKIVGNIATTMETSRKVARRLVMTESAYFSSASQKDCYLDLGIKKYEIVATLDSHTSEICQDLDGKVFKMSDYEPGVTAPPFHCWCRTCTCPYFNDEFTVGEKRAARSLNDKVEYIPSNIKYPEWKKKYIKDSEKLDEGDFINKIKSVFQNPIKAKVNEFNSSLQNIDNEDVRKLLIQSEQRIIFDKSVKKSSYFNSEEQKVYLKNNSDLSTIAHELFHEIDNTYKISETGMLIKYIENDYSRLKNMAIGYGKSIDEMIYSKYQNIFYVNDFDKNIVYKKYRGLSDIIHGMTNGKINLGYGHNKKGYWNKKNALSKETWAQYGRMLYEGNDDVLKVLNDIFPETTNRINEILKEMIK